MNISGSCTCGAVRYETSAEPVLQGNCHCQNCQKMTGSAYSATMFFPEQAVHIQGQVKYYTRQGNGGKHSARGFCEVCGTPLFGKPGTMPGLIGIRAGTLDDPNVYKPTVDIFTASAVSWDHMDPEITKFAGFPPHE